MRSGTVHTWRHVFTPAATSSALISSSSPNADLTALAIVVDAFFDQMYRAATLADGRAHHIVAEVAKDIRGGILSFGLISTKVSSHQTASILGMMTLLSM